MAGAQEIVFEIGGDASGLVSAGAAGAKALKSTEKAVGDLRKQIDRVSQANTAYQRSISTAAGVTDGFGKSARASASVFQREWDKAAQSIDRLKSQLDPAYAATKRYEAAVSSLDGAVKKGLISEAEKVRLLGLAEKAYLTAGDAAVVSGGKVGGFAGAMQRNGQSIQMVGYQVQDMAVQLAGGQSAMIVFAQQGSQIASAFGPIGAVIGTLAAVGLPLLGAAFAGAGEKAKSFDDLMSALEQSVSDLNDMASVYSADGLQGLIDKYGELNGAILEHIELQRQIDMASAMRATTDAMTALYDTLGGDLLSALGELEIRFNANATEALRLHGALVRATSAGSFDEQLAGAVELRDAIVQMTGGIDKMTAEQFDFFIKVQQSVDAMMQLKAAAPRTGWLNAAIAGASDLAAKMWEAATGAEAFANAQAGFVENAGPDERGSQRGQQQSAGAWRSQQAAADRARGGSGGGGGGGQNQLVSNLDSLRNSLMTEEQLEAESYARRQELLQAALAQRLITQQEFAALAEDAQRAHQEAMAEIDVWRYGDGQQKAAAFMGVLADTFQSGNERMQRMGRVFGAAEALINAWRAYNQTLANPSLPFMAKFAAAASVLSAGMKAVQAIKSGSGGSGGRSASPSASAPAAARPNMTANYTITGDVIGRQTGGELIKSINDALRAGYQINLEWA